MATLAVAAMAAGIGSAQAGLVTDLGITGFNSQVTIPGIGTINAGTTAYSSLGSSINFANALVTAVTDGYKASAVMTALTLLPGSSPAAAVTQGANGGWFVSIAQTSKSEIDIAGAGLVGWNPTSSFVTPDSYKNSAGQTVYSNQDYKITYTGVPGPIAGAGLPALLVLAGMAGLARIRSTGRSETFGHNL
jgi:hypothetical protein